MFAVLCEEMKIMIPSYATQTKTAPFTFSMEHSCDWAFDGFFTVC